jgi:DNA-binding response OmpR family regulator
VVPKEKLRLSVFGGEDAVHADAIEVLVHRLRKKLAATKVEILTLRGVGYLLCDDASSAASQRATR